MKKEALKGSLPASVLAKVKQADRADRIAQDAKAKYKGARKRYKQARKTAKKARKAAKAAIKNLKGKGRNSKPRRRQSVRPAPARKPGLEKRSVAPPAAAPGTL